VKTSHFLKSSTLPLISLCFCVTAFVTPVQAFAEMASRSYTVAPGDTLDKVIRKFYTGSALKVEAIRSVITEQNRGAFTKGEQKVLMAGAVITLPEESEIANGVINPKGSKGSERGEYRGENGLGGDSSNVHRNWVRFP